VASSRVYVQEGIYDQVVKKLVEKAKAWVVGDPFDPQVQQGPQVDKKQYEKILSYIEHGKREGATLLTGGKPLGGKGYYIEPTIFTDFKVYIYCPLYLHLWLLLVFLFLHLWLFLMTWSGRNAYSQG